MQKMLKLRRQTNHYAPGAFNIRDFTLPAPGFYGAIYNYRDSTRNLKDAAGNTINAVTVTGPAVRAR